MGKVGQLLGIAWHREGDSNPQNITCKIRPLESPVLSRNTRLIIYLQLNELQGKMASPRGGHLIPQLRTTSHVTGSDNLTLPLLKKPSSSIKRLPYSNLQTLSMNPVSAAQVRYAVRATPRRIANYYLKTVL